MFVIKTDITNEEGICVFVAKLLDCTINVIHLGLKYMIESNIWLLM